MKITTLFSQSPKELSGLLSKTYINVRICFTTVHGAYSAHSIILRQVNYNLYTLRLNDLQQYIFSTYTVNVCSNGLLY